MLNKRKSGTLKSAFQQQQKRFLLLTGPVLTFVAHSPVSANTLVPRSLHARIFTRAAICAR